MMFKNLHRIFFLPLLLLPLALQGQDYYKELTVNTFRKDKRFNDTLDFLHIDRARLNAAIFFSTNEVRVKQKLTELEYSPELENAALLHAEDMVKQGFFSHTNTVNPDRETPNDRARLVGIVNPYIAENIAEDFGLRYQSGTNVYVMGKGEFSYKPGGDLILPHTYLSLAGSLVKRWMNSPEHKRNILSKDALQMGCAVFFFIDEEFNDMPTFMAVQNFQWYEKIVL
jgi:uncharacterized protein YkwD